MSDNGQSEKFEQWAKLELFGRQVLAGKVSEQTIAGAGFIRIDVPAVGELPGFTRFFYPSAVYGITPTTEDLATKLAHAYREAPITRYELPAPRPVESPLTEREANMNPGDLAEEHAIREADDHEDDRFDTDDEDEDSEDD